MRKRWVVVVLLVIGGLLELVFDLYVGYYNSYIDHDGYRVYFLKNTPAFRREFINPFAMKVMCQPSMIYRPMSAANSPIIVDMHTG